MGISDPTFCPFNPVNATCSGRVDHKSTTMDCRRGRVRPTAGGGREPQSGVGTRGTEGVIRARMACDVATQTGVRCEVPPE